MLSRLFSLSARTLLRHAPRLIVSAAPRARSIALAAGGLASTVLVAAHCDVIALPWPELYRPSKVSPMSLQMAESVQGWQREIVEAMSKLDGVPFVIDTWGNEFRRGTSCVLENGNVFEKAAVNTTVAQVHNQPPERFKHLIVDHPQVKQLLDKGKPVDLYTASMSLILHPWNPHAPTVHANYRYFELNNGNPEDRVFWFGGGGDLTPAILYDEDAVHFHNTLKQACESSNGPKSKEYYPQFKQWCDKYFYIKHRQEARGVGGIFFDNLHDESPEQLFKFVDSCAKSLTPSYLPLVAKRKDTPYTEQQRHWQLVRRGRYVEFNLVYDKGTSYGLAQPGARVKSILVSMPATVKFEYDEREPAAGTKEANLLQALRKPREWADVKL